MPFNGVPEQPDGVWIGGLYWEDLDFGALALPAGYTEFGGLAEGVPAYAIVDQTAVLPDGLTKAFQAITSLNGTTGGIAFDAFSTLFTYGEVTMSVLLYEDDGNLSFGPTFGMGGLLAADAKGEYAGYRQGNAVSIELACYEIINGALNTVYSAGNVAGFNNSSPGEYYWVRLRISDEGGGNSRIRAQAWQGAFTDDPGGYLQNTVQVLDLTGVLGFMSRGMEAAGPDNIYQIGYFGFSEDPDVTPVPGPLDIIPAGGVGTPTLIDASSAFGAVFTGSAYVGDGAHQASQWQVDEQGGDFSTPIIDDTTGPVEVHSVSGLDPETVYEARLRYQNVGDTWSDWSPTLTWSTEAIAPPVVVIDVLQGTWIQASIQEPS